MKNYKLIFFYFAFTLILVISCTNPSNSEQNDLSDQIVSETNKTQSDNNTAWLLVSSNYTEDTWIDNEWIYYRNVNDFKYKYYLQEKRLETSGYYIGTSEITFSKKTKNYSLYENISFVKHYNSNNEELPELNTKHIEVSSYYTNFINCTFTEKTTKITTSSTGVETKKITENTLELIEELDNLSVYKYYDISTPEQYILIYSIGNVALKYEHYINNTIISYKTYEKWNDNPIPNEVFYNSCIYDSENNIISNFKYIVLEQSANKIKINITNNGESTNQTFIYRKFKIPFNYE